jgi:small conductance mechanosensitive channel
LQTYFNDLWIGFVQTIPRIVLALLVAAVAFWADDRLQRAVERAVGARRGQRELARLLGRLVRIAVLFVGLIIILSIFDQTGLLASFIASLGITGLLIAFALQDITKNFAAGVLLLIQRPFNLGDRIRVGANEGIVTDITLRATILRTIEGHEVIIPNADVFTAAIINLTRYPRRRYAVPLTLPLDVDFEAASRALVEALRQVPGIQAEPPPTVVSTAVGKDEQQLEARFWVDSTNDDWQTIVSAATRALQQEVQTLRAAQAETSPVEPA